MGKVFWKLRQQKITDRMFTIFEAVHYHPIMTNYYSSTYKTLKEDEKIIADSLKTISNKLNWSKIDDKGFTQIHKILSRLETLKRYYEVYLFDAYKLVSIKTETLLMVVSINSIEEKVSSSHQIRREMRTELEFAGLAVLKKDYGKVFIKPETLADKINDWANPIEVDFDADKEFSKRYYVLTDNEQKLREQLSTDFMAATKKHKDLEIEIDGRILLVRTLSRVSIESANTLAEFLSEICDGKN